MIVAGDIGGTKTNVALFEVQGGELSAPISQQSFPSGKYDSLDKILAEFIAGQRPPQPVTHACFGIAGPVVEGRVETPNLAWIVSDQSLAQTLNVARVGLINDLEATAYGVETLKKTQLYTLNEGESGRAGHRGLIAAGTGLGMAGIFWDGRNYLPLASEGGHMDFAPRTSIEIDLFHYMSEKLGGHVSYERVLSGPGLYNIYSFLRYQKFADEPEWLAEEIKSGDKTAAVSKAALSGKSELAMEALDLFTEIYGAMAGNLALLMKATGGLFIGGGIAPKIIEKLKDGSFMAAFKDKGRLSSLVASIPVHVILDDKTALYGAARCAFQQSKG
ncbi:MAG: glucokinase [Acidobacteriota bacterium]|nr:glucokinase [Acidobacteriota bacterium]